MERRAGFWQRRAQRSTVPSLLWVPGISLSAEQTPHGCPPPTGSRGRPAGRSQAGAGSLWRVCVPPGNMKGAAGHTVRGPQHRQWDLERTHAKQAEARLSQHLQSLERARLCRLRLLAWEQRQLQRQLQRLQTGNREGRAGAGHTAQAGPSQLLEHPDPDLRLWPGPPTTP